MEDGEDGEVEGSDDEDGLEEEDDEEDDEEEEEEDEDEDEEMLGAAIVILDVAMGDKLQARDRYGTWYDAKVVGARGEGVDREVKVHYCGWKSSRDEWVSGDSLRLASPERAPKRSRSMRDEASKAGGGEGEGEEAMEEEEVEVDEEVDEEEEEEEETLGAEISILDVAVEDKLQSRDRYGDWYDAKVVGERGEGADREVNVHYSGWKKSQDEWVRGDWLRAATNCSRKRPIRAPILRAAFGKAQAGGKEQAEGKEVPQEKVDLCAKACVSCPMKLQPEWSFCPMCGNQRAVTPSPDLASSAINPGAAAQAPERFQAGAEQQLAVNTAVGDRVQACDRHGNWYDAKVVERGEGVNREVKVHFVGWSKTQDAWVGGDRLRGAVPPPLQARSSNAAQPSLAPASGFSPPP